ncbi:hypothetical protein FGO68_gene14064 [Halteria grandinella]|uniref:4'-phosphopantetheinyl transferase domain-containing protein n=1 Tax=Halteria grandinella TaxID=5974 RepID=A0A8J8NI34_HALGN|nr:hypothetical protein FGO68_gene14064 [Halteria grandinella]
MALKIPRIFGVGTDICSVQRMTHMIDRGPQFLDRFLKRVLHDQEIEEFKKINQSQEDVKQAGQYLASRWAFKEAMVKASGNTGLYYPGMYLKKGENKGKPMPTIEGELNVKILFEELQISGIHASISHEDQFAVAFVTLESLLVI